MIVAATFMALLLGNPVTLFIYVMLVGHLEMNRLKRYHELYQDAVIIGYKGRMSAGGAYFYCPYIPISGVTNVRP